MSQESPDRSYQSKIDLFKSSFCLFGWIPREIQASRVADGYTCRALLIDMELVIGWCLEWDQSLRAFQDVREYHSDVTHLQFTLLILISTEKHRHNSLFEIPIIVLTPFIHDRVW